VNNPPTKVDAGLTLTDAVNDVGIITVTCALFSCPVDTPCPLLASVPFIVNDTTAVPVNGVLKLYMYVAPAPLARLTALPDTTARFVRLPLDITGAPLGDTPNAVAPPVLVTVRYAVTTCPSDTTPCATLQLPTSTGAVWMTATPAEPLGMALIGSPRLLKPLALPLNPTTPAPLAAYTKV
jgi:hypothetical protein